MRGYIICLGGEMTDVHLNFFKNLEILKEEKVSDTHFITFENGDSSMAFSISQKEYDRVKIDLREDRIVSIIGN